MVNSGKDTAFALRMLARNPGFTFVVVATLALGIGVSSAVFGVVDGVLLKPLPFRDPDRLTTVWQKTAAGQMLGISELDLDDYRARTRVFQGLGGYTVPATKSAILTGAGDPLEISPSYITRNYFSVLGAAPVIGRDFLPDEGLRGRNDVAILGYALWQSRFGGSRDVLSRQITLNRRKLQVVGVMGPDVFPDEAAVFLPFTQISPEKPMPRNYHELNVIGRMRAGLSLADAQREMAVLSVDLERAYPATNAGLGAYISLLREEITGKVREPVLMLLMAVGLVLLIACGNVANLLLVRAAARQKEIAVRVALGAGRDRILAQFITECLLLSTAGSAMGLLLALVILPAIRRLGVERIPRLDHIGIDWRVLLFTTAITLLAGLIFGLIPALQTSSANLNQTLRASGRTSTSDSGRLRNLLVAGEVALALVVIIGAGVLVRSLNQLQEVHPGFRTDHLLVAHLALPPSHYKQADVNNFYVRVLPKIAAIPGVVSVSATTSLPLESAVIQTRFLVQGAPLPEPGRYPVAALASVGPEFFKTMGIPIVRGRTFNREETGDLEEERCIINAALARNFLAGQDPIGRILLSNLALPQPEPCRIVGVAGDTRIAGLDAAPQPVIYFASYVARETLVVRTSTDPMAVAPDLQRAVAAADPEQPLSGVRSMEDVIWRSLSRRSFAVVLLVAFSGLGLILAALGLYGVVSYSVAQRTQEIGVRMAVGAEPRRVFRLILGQGLRVTAMGLIAGTIAAAGATRLMSGLLFGIGPADPVSFATGCLLLVLVSALACFVPAYRATRVDPLVALRYE